MPGEGGFDSHALPPLRTPRSQLVELKAISDGYPLGRDGNRRWSASSYLVELTSGDYSNLKIDAVANLPLSEQWGLRVAARRHTRDGYVWNLGPGLM